MSSVPTLPGPTDSFPYRVDREAGSGAMGVVYRAIDIALERPVAIKVLRSELVQGEDDEPRKRFLQEARAAAALSHPGGAGTRHGRRGGANQTQRKDGRPTG